MPVPITKAKWIGRTVKLGGGTALLLGLSMAGALPRSLEAIGQRGSLAVCAHPNALPYSSKRGPLPGFQIELAEALAERLGVSLARHWVINSFQYRRADCDVVLNAIADKAALAEVGLRISRPYYRTGVVLAVREDSPVSSLAHPAPHFVRRHPLSQGEREPSMRLTQTVPVTIRFQRNMR